VTGVVIGGTSGVTFAEAKLTYGQGATKPGGFEMTVTKSPQGYLLTTQSMIPATAAKYCSSTQGYGVAEVVVPR